MRALRRLLLRQLDIRLIILSHLVALAYQIVSAFGFTPLSHIQAGDFVFQAIQRYAPIAFTIVSLINNILFHKTLKKALAIVEAFEKVAEAKRRVIGSIRVVFGRRRRRAYWTSIVMAISSLILGLASYLVLYKPCLALAFLILAPISAYSAYYIINNRI